MAIEQLKVWEIVDRAVDKKYDIPEFQRDFVWGTDKVKSLAESLYLDYPVGSFLLWDSSDYQESKRALGSEASLWIVDGQQRTVALCLLLGKKPYWWSRADVWNKYLKTFNVMARIYSADSNDTRIEFAMENPIRRKDPSWISLKEILSIDTKEKKKLSNLAHEISAELEKHNIADAYDEVHSNILGLIDVRNCEIPAVKIKHEAEDVAEIFARLNQKGTRVKEADVVLALASVRNPGWIRKEYVPYNERLKDRGWDLDAGVFIRTTTGIGCSRARLKEVAPEFWEPSSLPLAWKQTKKTINACVKALTQHGLTCSDLLPSVNSLIPLFILHNRWSNRADYSFDEAFCWFLLANRDGRYSGAAITTLDEDIRIISNASSFSDALIALRSNLQVSEEISPDEFFSRFDRQGNAFYRLMIFLTEYDRKACDWVDGMRLGYDRVGGPVVAGFMPEWHHIFPKSLLKNKIPIEKRQALANITVLNEETNRKKLKNKKPADYIREFKINKKLLKSHHIPNEFALPYSSANLNRSWGLNRYNRFITARAEVLSRAATDYLRRLSSS